MSKDLVPVDEKCCATCLFWFSEREFIKNESGEKYYKILKVRYKQYCFNKKSCCYEKITKDKSKCEEYLSKYIFEKMLSDK